MTVAELLGRISSRELTEWYAYHSLDAKDQKEAMQRAELQSKAKAGARKRR